MNLNWSEFAPKAAPVFPSYTDTINRLRSEMTRGGKVPTWEEAEAEYGRRYALDAMADAR